MTDQVTSNFAARGCGPQRIGAPKALPFLLACNTAATRARLWQCATSDIRANQSN